MPLCWVSPFSLFQLSFVSGLHPLDFKFLEGRDCLSYFCVFISPTFSTMPATQKVLNKCFLIDIKLILVFTVEKYLVPGSLLFKSGVIHHWPVRPWHGALERDLDLQEDCHLPLLWSPPNHFTSLGFSFFMCNSRGLSRWLLRSLNPWPFDPVQVCWEWSRSRQVFTRSWRENKVSSLRYLWGAFPILSNLTCHFMGLSQDRAFLPGKKRTSAGQHRFQDTGNTLLLSPDSMKLETMQKRGPK